jgi:hypothetical protein
MPTNSTVSVGTSATLLATGSVPSHLGGQRIDLVNLHATSVVYVGGSNAVTVSNGFRIPSGSATNGAFSLTLYQGEQLWAIASVAATDVRVLTSP